MQESFSFDDVLLVPQYSNIESRSEVDISVKLSKGIEVKTPIIPANMATITGMEMCREMLRVGSMSIVHRFMSVEEQIDIPMTLAKENDNAWSFVGLSVGVKKEDYNTVDKMVNAGAKILCIDVAHGHSKMCVDMCKYIASKYPNVFLIAGNIASLEGAFMLWEAGADAVKCGIGSGAICSTRVETGNGYPQLSLIMEIAKRRRRVIYNKTGYIISDGGIKTPGDCVKAIAGGADMIMAGGMLAGTDETPGNVVQVDGKSYKSYDGSSTYKTNRVEGVKALVPTNGKVSLVMDRIKDGLQSGCSYQGARSLHQLQLNAKFVRITNNGLIESKPHVNGIVL